MKNDNFPVYKTKVPGVTERFDLNDPEGRRKYFLAKAGPEIEKLQKYLAGGSFLAYLLGKKNSGKGTYSKLFMEAVGRDKVGHLSVGDVVRDVHQSLENETEKQKLLEFLKNNYRGFHTVEETLDLISGRSQSSLVSSELILALIKYEISKRPRQSVFIDGFPRALDQISYSMFLRDLLGFREDPDFFVFINVPTSVIDERIKYRVICPVCKTPRNTKLLTTKQVGYDESTKTFFLLCDNEECKGTRMVPKEGDELGIEPIRARLEVDDQVMAQLEKLSGVPKIFLRNCVPVAEAGDFVDDYEITPAYSYEWDSATKTVKTIESAWEVLDDEGVPSYSLLPSAVAVSLIKEIARVLGL